MECKVQLLRRPLPPKSHKLPLPKTPYKAKTAPLPEKFIQDTTAYIEKQARFPETCIAKPQCQVNVKNIVFEQHVSERITTTSAPSKRFKSVHWNIPEMSFGPVFVSDFLAPSTQMLREKKRYKKKSERESTKHRSNLATKMQKDSEEVAFHFLTPTNFNPQFGPSQDVSISTSYKYLPKILAIGLNPSMITTTITKVKPWPGYKQRRMAFSVNVHNLADTVSLPKLPLPRRPQTQSNLEALIDQKKSRARFPRLLGIYASKFSKIIRNGEFYQITRKTDESVPYAIQGEGFKMFKTIAATQYETVLAMVHLAIRNCQLFGRNALNLKGFFILNCPDLTSLAQQLVYINLSYNDISNFPTEVLCVKNLQVLILRNNPIKEIPSAIQQLKFLRILNMAFNLLTSLPAGLFDLCHLRKLDIAYNNVTTLPNDIQKLRSLVKLSIDGNELVTFPSAILRLNLKKISFENNFTHHFFWKQTIPTVFKPQSLTKIAALVFLKNKLNLYYDNIPAEITKHLKWTSTCDWCHGPMFEESFTTIRTFDIFGGKHLPVIFHVCSPTCFNDLSKGGFPLKNALLFKDWSRVLNQSDSTTGKMYTVHTSDRSLVSGTSRSEP